MTKQLGQLAVLVLLTLACGGDAISAPPARPHNVLLIAIDDLNDWVACLGGHPQAQTPNMDRLAARGTLFRNAHCQSPLCNPSRASLLTGLRPSSTGIYGLAPGIRDVARTRGCVTLPQYFAQHGYFTATFGKIFHDGSIPAPLRTNEFNVWGPAPGMTMPPVKFVNTPLPMRLMDWGVFPKDDRTQADWRIADAAIAQIKSLPPDKPFFLAVGFRLPHVPCFASQQWFDRFPPEEQILLPPVKQRDRDDTPEFSWYLHWKLPEPRLSWLKQSGQWRALVRAYLASTTFMDSQLGRVLDALQATGRGDHTVVVLWSDNAWHLGEKAITGKNSLWDRSTHVPLIFAGPGTGQGAQCSQPAELLDIYPTLVELCGLPAKAELEGHSLVPQLKDPTAFRSWPAITSHNQGNDTVRTEHWRYIRYGDGSEELYDYRSDPNEWTNLVADAKFSATRKELARWLPKAPAPPAPGSAHRVLVKKNGVWLWEGKPINPAEKDE
ncbi:MAG TPA: sulfatase [Candidatus Paceibacterota bacterium]|nr:sulfatase [Verrucomicrobiota bacterium]HSA10987.1 sulfatase [Candidatus Paceibacterota bacterium]